jgi:SAM-dependent methyltransferase
MSEQPELTSDPTARFTGRTADYARYRPTYPQAAIDALYTGLGEPKNLDVADVGAGTGISTRLLAENGANVLAVEPNAEMRAAAAALGLTTHDARAESTGLPAAAFDLVTMFQAFHWVEPYAALAEFKRILKPHGRVGLVWNIRDDSDDFTRGYGDIFDREREREISATFSFDWEGVEAALQRAGFSGVRKQSFRNAQRVDVDGLLGRARSASYVPLDGPRRDEILGGLRELHARFARDGFADLVMRTDVYTGSP